MTFVSPHFTLEELIVHPSTPQFDNTPDVEIRQSLTKLANYLLERTRTTLGVPIKITSGYRSPDVNHFVGGSATSSHLYGCAADTTPIGVDLTTAYKVLQDDPGLDYDQLIYEMKGTREGYTSWIHVGMVSPIHTTARREALIYTPLTHGQYLPFNTSLIPT